MNRKMRSTFTLPLLLALALAGAAARAADESPTADVKGSADHPVISRFSGSLLVGYGQQDWATTALPGAGGMGARRAALFQTLSVVR